MKHEFIVDHDVIGRYRSGVLAAEDAEAFETHLLDCEECRAALDADARLERGLRSIAATRAAASPPGVRARKVFGTVFAAAAAAAMLFLAPRFMAPVPEPQTDLPVFQLALSRGSGDAAAIELNVSSAVAWYALELEVPVVDEQCCRVVIEDENGGSVWEGEARPSSDTGVVRVLFSRNFLHAGGYRVILYATSAHTARLIEYQVFVRLNG